MLRLSIAVNYMDLFEAVAQQEAEPTLEPKKDDVLGVSALSRALQKTVESTFGRISVQGEIVGLKVAASGHAYLNLKEGDDTINAVMWRSTVARLSMQPADGLQVIARGKLSTYSARSSYQLVIDSMQPAGQGTLLQQLEQLKQKLAAEGLFDTDRKQQLPFLPARIGLVTSSSGAVLHDMLNRLQQRGPRPVKLWPVKVQGVGAAEEIATAVSGFNAMPTNEQPSVIIVARGGGSLEDLWAFNEEPVVRAIAESAIPVISGVGHEPDVTLADFVADLRAPTPTAAIEHAVPVQADVDHTLYQWAHRASRAQQQRLAYAKQQLQGMQQALRDPRMILANQQQRLEDRAERLTLAMKNQLTNWQGRSQQLAAVLKANNPQAPLEKGYAMVSTENGEAVTSAKTSATNIQLRFKDGTRSATLKPAS